MDLLTSLSGTSSNSITGVLGSSDSSSIFDPLLQQQNGMENLSDQFLKTGIDQYLNKNYKKAAKTFQAAINLAPNSSYNIDSSKYLVQTYLQLGETDNAIDTYKAAIKRNPKQDDLMTGLGKLYYSEGNYTDAAAQYKAAVQVNPSSTNRFSYGEALIKVGNYSEAEHQFQEVKRLAPESYAGDYGLGKLYEKMGNDKQAIAHFQKALDLEPTFYDAQAEMGYTYADMGDIDKAKDVLNKLTKNDESLAQTLQEYINQKEPPKISFALSTSTFPYYASKGDQVSSIDSYLQNAGAEMSMTMQFSFSKEMDPTSVENPLNWNISRASSSNLAKTYNFGDTIPSTEITLNSLPDYVLYDKDTLTATVGFTMRQNATADGTIDPSHIVFKFDGKDAYGVSMDPNGDEFSGFSGVA
jgi:tetratricopeptide (TPR) repeat protein